MKNILKKIFYFKIQNELRGCERVLDLGCGQSSILQNLPKKFYSVGVDAYLPYIEKSKEMNIHDEYVVVDMLKVDFPEKSFDAIICFEVVEHLEREVAIALMNKMERWAKKKIIITTPNGFIPQGEYDGNELQEHKSGWTSRDFKNLGFETRGLQGLKIFGNSKYPIVAILWHISFPLVYFFPSLSWRLLAIKTLK